MPAKHGTSRTRMKFAMGEASIEGVRAAPLAAVCAWLLCALCGSAAAQAGRDENPSLALDRLTLPRAEALFDQRNREVRLARRATEAAEADVTAASARPNPTLSVNPANVSASAGLHWATPWDRNFNTVVGVQQLFERGGKRELRTQAAEYGLVASRSEQSDTQRQQRA